MTDVVLDTDIASLIRKRRLPPQLRQHVDGRRVWLTFVSVGELSAWPEVRNWGIPRRAGLAAFLDQIPVLPADRTVGSLWGQIIGRAQQRGRRRPVNDSWIAACCIRHEIPLLTGNQRDFTDFARHDGLVLLG